MKLKDAVELTKESTKESRKRKKRYKEKGEIDISYLVVMPKYVKKKFYMCIWSQLRKVKYFNSIPLSFQERMETFQKQICSITESKYGRS